MFTQVLLICDQPVLIGLEMFAIDEANLPSNASKTRKGGREAVQREATKAEVAVAKIIERHQARDGPPTAGKLITREKHARSSGYNAKRDSSANVFRES